MKKIKIIACAIFNSIKDSIFPHESSIKDVGLLILCVFCAIIASIVMIIVPFSLVLLMLWIALSMDMTNKEDIDFRNSSIIFAILYTFMFTIGVTFMTDARTFYSITNLNQACDCIAIIPAIIFGVVCNYIRKFMETFKYHMKKCSDKFKE